MQPMNVSTWNWRDLCLLLCLKGKYESEEIKLVYLNVRFTMSPLKAWVDEWLLSPRIKTLVLAMASIPSVTAVKEYSRSVTGTCILRADNLKYEGRERFKI